MFQRMVPPLTNQCCIYRVPWRLRKLNKSDYTPCAISFGPFHHGRPELQFMEKHKERFGISCGALLLELNRVICPGGYFVWSATPIYQKQLEEYVKIRNGNI